MTQNKPIKSDHADISVLKNPVFEDGKDLVSFSAVVIKNLLDQLPLLNIFTGTAFDYYDQKVTKKRQQEIDSLINLLSNKLEHLELKQEAIDYFEQSILFKIEEITIKLITNPNKKYDEIFSEYITSSLSDISSTPELKDLILSTLLSIDIVDVKILLIINRISSYKMTTPNSTLGVKFQEIEKDAAQKNLGAFILSRSLQRLESEDLIVPLSRPGAPIQENPSRESILQGSKPPQFYPVSGFIITGFGNQFIKFNHLNSIY